ncbi:hypothetical protein LTS17_003151 [Exophiala oligosperma]
MESQVNRRIICMRCAKIKQACDGGSPCSRCNRLEVSCEPNLVGGDGDTGRRSTSKPVKITRTQTGCLSCKKRKRKCDESRPKCGDCRRLCLNCTYIDPPIGSKRVTPTYKNSSQSPSVGNDDTTERSSYEENLFNFDADSLNDVADSISWQDVTEVWPLVPQSQMAVYSSDTGSTPSPDPALSLLMLSTAPDIATDEDKSLLNHYMRIVAGVLSRRDDHRSNPYLSKILPMALSNRLVMDAVLALSANHWKKLQPTVWKRGTIHQTNALQSLAKLLPHIERESADAALSATLLLCMIELFDGTSSHWKFHLDGARRLLSAFDQKSNWAQRTEYRTFCRQLYHYLDSATTISTCHPPLLEVGKDESGKVATPEAMSPRDDLDDEAALYGVPKSLFHFVDKINGLAYQRKFRDDPVFENMFRASATRLEKELEHWSRDHKSNASHSSSSDCLQEIPVQNATTAFEQALQLRLHQVVNGYSLHHDKVKDCVSQILDSIQQIRYGSPLESSLVFPLVMAGSSCSTESDRLIIRDRLMVMERTLGFRYIYTAHELVQRVWKERDINIGTETEVNWAAIRYFQLPGLALV